MAAKLVRFSAPYLSYQLWYQHGNKDKVIKFSGGYFSTTDPIQIKVLRAHKLIKEVKSAPDKELANLTDADERVKKDNKAK